MWTQANDGSGSGLDADRLDGKHASSFLTSANLDCVRVKASNSDSVDCPPGTVVMGGGATCEKSTHTICRSGPSVSLDQWFVDCCVSLGTRTPQSIYAVCCDIS